MQIERVISLAKKLLIIDVDESRKDLWLWSHSERVMRLTGLVAELPELQDRSADRAALAVAALFHDAGWALEHQQGRFERWQMLTRPTSDIQRELGAAVLLEEAAHLLPANTARLASEAIRHCNDRHTELVEASILADSEALDEIGVLYVLRQFRLYQAEGRPLQQLVDTWRRQKEYRYWELRLSDGFHWQTTRELARQRLAAAEAFMQALASDLSGDDVAGLLSSLGAAAPESPRP